MKRLLALILMLAVLSALTACGSGNKEYVDANSQNIFKTDLSNADSDSSMYTDFSSDSYDTLIKLIECRNEGDLATYHNLLYGDFDYDKAMHLYFTCLDDIYGEGASDRLNRNMLAKYNTSDYITAYEVYETILGRSNYSPDYFKNTGTLTLDECKEIIDEYNGDVDSLSYMLNDMSTENEYSDYVNNAMESMYIDLSDVDEIAHYLYANNGDVYIMKIKGAWYPCASGYPAYAFFADELLDE